MPLPPTQETLQTSDVICNKYLMQLPYTVEPYTEDKASHSKLILLQLLPVHIHHVCDCLPFHTPPYREHKDGFNN